MTIFLGFCFSGNETLEEIQFHSTLSGGCQPAPGIQAVYFSKLLLSWRPGHGSGAN